VPELPVVDDTDIIDVKGNGNGNGNGNGHGHSRRAMDLTAMITNQQDAPTCPGCGHVAVRNGACYKCLNCGNSMGCS